MLDRRELLRRGAGTAALLLGGLKAAATAGETPRRDDYLRYVTTFADTLIAKGTDRYGNRRTALWASVIDTRTGDAPPPDATVSSPRGTRSGDRAVGGSNLLHDVVTIRCFRLLSAVTGQARYANAADAYLKDTLRYAQSPATGLIAWGEHTYYDMFAEHGSINHYYETKKHGVWHELLAWTPPWEDLWRLDPERTEKAITGLRYHFFDADATGFLFNRHAHWDVARYQPRTGSQPWIKHSALYCHAYLFLHARTGNPDALRRARGLAALYWDRRHPKTGLTIGCIGDPRATSQIAQLGGTTCLSYWLLKAHALFPQETTLPHRALSLLKSYDRYGWDAKREGYYAELNLDGKPTTETLTPTWASEYGEGNLLKVGRFAAWIAKTSGDADCLRIARRAAMAARRDAPPKEHVAEPIGYALGLALDLYDATHEPAYLDDARRWADYAIAQFWRSGLFTRQINDPYYEAKLGTGDLALGLLRLHLRLHPEIREPAHADWSI
jgi:hypothetical protein